MIGKNMQTELIIGLCQSVYSKTLDELLTELREIHHSKSILITTLNSSHLRQASRNISLFQIISDSLYIVADGFPVQLVVKHFLKRDCNRITGVDLVKSILLRQEKIFVIGSSGSAIKKSLHKLNLDYNENYFGFDDSLLLIDSENQLMHIASEINSLQPKYVFLALGIPKQEIYFQHLVNSQLMTVPTIFIGVGGTFEILSGKFPRCPKFLQMLGFEWLWRLHLEPRRLFRRYCLDGFFLLELIFLWFIKSVRGRRFS